MLKTSRWLSVVFLTFCVACSRPSAADSQKQKPDEATEKRLAEIAASLPVDEPVRQLLEDGFRANGIHKQWMDAMKGQGVKQVLIDVKGTWYMKIGFRPDKVVRVVYRTEYSSPGSQIVEDTRLEALQKSGLQHQLETVAIEESKQAAWMRIDYNPVSLGGHAHVCLADDEWVPCGPWRMDRPGFSGFEEEKYPLYSAAIFPDLAAASKLLATSHFSQTDLNIALYAATQNSSDNTKMIELLVKAGADVNARLSGGSTLLMQAASGLRLTNVKLLLSLGADPNSKNPKGDTALSWIEDRIALQKGSGPPLPGYVSEIVRLLKEAGAKS
jgi:hypothetical protein